MDSYDFAGGGPAGCVLATDGQRSPVSIGWCLPDGRRCDVAGRFQLRTRGIGGLRIAGDSIVAPAVSGSTNATVYVIAGRAVAPAGR